MKSEPWPLVPEIDTASSALEAPPILVSDPKSVRVRLAGASTTSVAIPINTDVRIAGLNELDLAGRVAEEEVRTWKHSFRNARNRFGALMNRVGLENEKFTVLSNDCWGQALYPGYGLPYQTPLVGSGMYSDCFLRFLGDIEGYLQSPLRFVSDTRYPGLQRIRNQRRAWPIAVLRDDVEIHFMHYQSEYTSRRAWEIGLESMHLDRIAVKFTVDKDGATEEQVKQFAALPFERKLLISRRSRPEIACAVQTPDFVINGAVMFRRSLKYFDCTHWLNTGEIATDTPRVWLSKLIYARGA